MTRIPDTETTVTDNQTPSETPAAAERDWKSLGLSQAALDLIEKAGFKQPTEIQTQAIPLVLEGHDLIASAQTGTGKTATFVLPMVERFAGREGTFGLILAPTREIAQQIQQTIELLGAPRGVRSIVLIGGIDMKIDAKAINTYPQIIVATPGRLCDHLDRGNIWLDFIKMVVLDEADRMLDMGFSAQLSRIVEDLPKERQSLVFSATFSGRMQALAQKALQNPKRVSVGKPMAAATSVEQKLLWVHPDSKNRELARVLKEETGSVIVFARSKDEASRVYRTLHSRGFYDATYIHSDRLQSHREQALADFKSGKYRILVATDVAARGIHVDGVALVVNFDLPFEPEDYVHRIGRTGRIGMTGKAVSFATHRDRSIVKRIETMIKKPIPSENVEGGESRGSSQSRGDRPSHRSEASKPQSQMEGAPSPRTEAAPNSQEEGGQKRRRKRRRGPRRPPNTGAEGTPPSSSES